MTCTKCNTRPAAAPYRKCDVCLARNRRSARASYARRRHLLPAPMRSRALTLLSTFILTPRELSCALDISITHASTLLKRLWEAGACERWPYRDRSYRYRLRGAP